MKKTGILALFAAIIAPTFVGAAQPRPAPNQPYFQQTGFQQQPVILQPYNSQGTVFIPQNTVGQMPTAAQPTRVTGNLPRVGSNNTSTMRQYYHPNNFDRISDSGLYIGLSIAYNGSLSGGMRADYARETNAFFVPGAFEQAAWKSDTVLPLQISVGAAINSDIRVDFSYTRYSGLSYPDYVQTSDGAGGFFTVEATGGGITSNATMLNLYYNLDSYTGYIAGGALRPYIGVGVGISTNTISDYLVYDGKFYAEVPEGTPSVAGQLTAISDIYAYHSGGTTENLAYMFEGGVTTELDGGIKVDFFVRYSGLGKVQSSGSIVVSQTEWLGTGFGVIGEAGAEQPAPYDSVFHYTNWRESGNLAAVDLGVRLRLQF
ncbi:MAG: hypothetical protein FWG18_02525 [Alphaproteobacteria bacterium]|nr:hypothetical protein [Alphaproteobacteria bacterium]